jgi:hypothetical protein
MISFYQNQKNLLKKKHKHLNLLEKFLFLYKSIIIVYYILNKIKMITFLIKFLFIPIYLPNAA